MNIETAAQALAKLNEDEWMGLDDWSKRSYRQEAEVAINAYRTLTDDQWEAQREKVAREIAEQGWSCEMHEPDYYCSACQPMLLRTASAVMSALGFRRAGVQP